MAEKVILILWPVILQSGSMWSTRDHLVEGRLPAKNDSELTLRSKFWTPLDEVLGRPGGHALRQLLGCPLGYTLVTSEEMKPPAVERMENPDVRKGFIQRPGDRSLDNCVTPR